MKLYYSDGAALQGPLGSIIVKEHPNNTVTFRVIDHAWLVKNGWNPPECYVEVQAKPMPVHRLPPRDDYVWEP